MRAGIGRRVHLEWLAWVVLGVVAALPLLHLVTRSELSGEPLRDTRATLHALGRASGALAEGLLVVVVALGLQSRLLERILGPLDRLTRVHHHVGVATYVTVLVHPVALAGAEAVTSWRSSSQTLFALQRPSIALGWAALLVLVLVVCSSFTGRLRHETWRRIHVLGWFAAALGISHTVAIRGVNAVDAVLVVVLTVAVAEKVRDVVFDTARYRVAEVKQLKNARMIEVDLEPVGRGVRFQPGQFVFIRFYDPRTRWRCREFHPFTITSAQREAHLRITVKERGDCTRRLLEVEQGFMAEVRGPFGSLFRDAAPARQVWLAGGVGIAPFLSAARALGASAPAIDLFYCTKRAADAVHLEELRELAEDHPSLHVHQHVDEYDGFLSVDRVLSDAGARDAEFFIAGPAGFADALRTGLLAHQVAPARIHHERFEYL